MFTSIRLYYSHVKKNANVEDGINLMSGSNGHAQHNEKSTSNPFNSDKLNQNCSELLFSEQLMCEALKGDNASKLTLLQYEQMTKQEKFPISNRVRQYALKARESLPNKHGLFCLVIGHLLQNAHRYFNLDSPSDMQLNVMESSFQIKACSDQGSKICKSANWKLWEVCDLKKKKRLQQQQELVTELRDMYQSFRNISAMSGVPLKTVHNWCSLPEKKTA